MGKHGSVTHKLVNNIRLRSVKRFLMMSDVLGGMEDLEGKTVQELTLGEKTSNRLQSPSCLSFEERRDIFKLRNLSLAQINLFLKLCDSPVKFFTCVVFEQMNEFFVTEGPHVFLLLSVLKSWDFIDHFVLHCQIGDLLSSCAIDGVAETWVVSILNTIAFGQNPFSDVIEVIHIDWEPGNGF